MDEDVKTCELPSCWFPTLKGHHHHLRAGTAGHINTTTCQCTTPENEFTRFHGTEES